MKKNRLYLVRKYVIATSAKEAIKKELQEPVHDVWLQEDSLRDYVVDTNIALRGKNKNIGFNKK